MRPPLVSAFLLARGSPESIDATARSVLRQRHGAIELFIIGTDQAAAETVVGGIDDERIRLIPHQANAPDVIAARQAGLNACSGQYLWAPQAGDEFDPEMLSRWLEAFEASEAVDVVLTPRPDPGKSHDAPQADPNDPAAWIWNGSFSRSYALVRSAQAATLWSDDSGLEAMEEWYTGVRWLSGGARFRLCPGLAGNRHAASPRLGTDERSYWEYAYASSRLLHPLLLERDRGLLMRNLAGFLDHRLFPASPGGRSRLIGLLLGVSDTAGCFSPIWNQRDQAANQIAAEFAASLQQQLLEARCHLESMRIESRRGESELFKARRLANLLCSFQWSWWKLAQALYLLVACSVPDILKLAFRAPVRKLERITRTVRNRGHSTPPYSVEIRGALEPDRPRIVHALANFSMGGSSQLVVDLIERLGHAYDQQVLSLLVPAPVAYRNCTVSEYQSLVDIRSHLRRVKPDLVHVHYWGDKDWSWYEKVFQAASDIGCKVVENVNTPITPYMADDIHRYIFVSRYVREVFGWNCSNAEVVYPGSNFDLFRPLPTKGTAADCIGMVYRLESDKLNEASIEPLIQVVKNRPGTRALVVGDGCYLKTYRARVAECGLESQFRFTGAVPYQDLPSLYAQMSVFVAPVWKESFGQVTPFAMSMGLPVAGYAVGALEEILGGRETLAPPGDAEGLADIITGLLDKPARRRAIGDQNRERALSRFSVEAMIGQYRTIYRQILQNPP